VIKIAPVVVACIVLLALSAFSAPSAAQELLQAIQSGDRDRVEAILAEDPGALEEAGPRGMMPVDLAFYMDCQRSSDLTALLISRGAAFDANVPILGRPKLLVAIAFGKTDMVRFLLEHGADPDAQGPSGAALHDSARRGHDEIVSVLLGAGAEVDALDPMGAPPLRWAVERGHLGIVEQLFEAGAGAGHTGLEDGMGLLHNAALSGHLGIVGQLLDQGVAVSSQDAAGHTPLYYAARYGHTRVAERLRSAGAPPSEVGEENTHPSPYLQGGIGDGEAAVGFLTPSEIGDQDVLVFYSAYHGYVDEPAYIHTIADSLRAVTYLHNAGDEFRGSERALFLTPRAQEEVGEVRFTTVEPTVEMTSLGYLIEMDGLVLYYQGFGPDDLERYREEMDFLAATLAGRAIDLALLPVPGRGAEGAREYLGIFLENFNPGSVAVHTPPAQLRILPTAAEILRELEYEGRIVFATHPGDLFVLGK
jgi:ankyrin repeat protein